MYPQSTSSASRPIGVPKVEPNDAYRRPAACFPKRTSQKDGHVTALFSSLIKVRRRPFFGVIQCKA